MRDEQQYACIYIPNRDDVEQSCSKGGYIALRHFDLEGLLWCLVTDKDPLEVEMSHCNVPPSYVIAQQCPHLV